MTDLPPEDPCSHTEDELNQLSAEIGRRKARGEDASDLIARHRELREAARPTGCPSTSLGGASLRVSVCDRPAEFAALRDEWNELIEDSDTYSPFLAWEWLYPWWETYGDGCQFRLLLARSLAGRLDGIAPLMVRRDRLGRCLAFIGTGKDSPRGDYFGLVARRGVETAVSRTLTAAMCDRARGWEHACLEHLRWSPSTSDLAQLLSAQDGHLAVTETEGECVWGQLPTTFEGFIAAVPHRRRRWNLRTQDQRLREVHPDATFETCPTASEVGQSLNRLAGMSIRRKSARGETSSFADTRSLAMRQRAAELFRERGWLRLDELRVEGRVIASLMGFQFRGTYFCYQMGFDDEFAEFGPVHCLLGHRIAQLISDGITRFDFLAGDEPYKREYFANTHTELSLRLFPDTFAGSRAAALFTTRRFLKHAKRKLLRKG